MNIAVYSLLTAKMTYYMKTPEGAGNQGNGEEYITKICMFFYKTVNIILVIISE